MQARQTASRRSGRPDARAAETLDRRILDTATRLFIEQGYAPTSVDQIAMTARASKATIYHRHSSKEELFAAVITDMTAVMLETAVSAERAEKDASDPLANLREVSRAFLELTIRPEAIALYRILIAESPRFPEMIRVMQAVRVPLDAVYLRLLNAARDAGQIRGDVPVEDISQMLDSLICGWVVRQYVMSVRALSTQAERDSYFNTAWAIFLNGVTYT
ncbi:MAG: TetR/AcrR family transcriptional regulator [Magnetospirillum sp.]|nr:TetR/AcrR family transcriptional regulator [Magnetospirillum sp.]